MSLRINVYLKGCCYFLANIEELKQYKNIHMIGIGGISMSGIAEILKFWGFHVTGSDTSSSEVTEKLIKY